MSCTGRGSHGVRCIAAVIPYRIPGTDAMSCSMPGDQVTDEEADRVDALLAETTDELGDVCAGPLSAEYSRPTLIDPVSPAADIWRSECRF
jgi:hypothetical protein